jgi:hypothetical protein
MYITFFRNVGSGFRMPFTDPSVGGLVDDFTGKAYYCPNGLTSCESWTPGPLRAAGPMGYNYWFAYVGNVLGTSGESTAAHGWTYSGDFTASRIFMLGWGAGGGGQDPNLNGITGSYILINGNYDYLNNAVTWQGSPVTLPDSFYLSGTPAFFTAGSGYLWPWVTPTDPQPIEDRPVRLRRDVLRPACPGALASRHAFCPALISGNAELSRLRWRSASSRPTARYRAHNGSQLACNRQALAAHRSGMGSRHSPEFCRSADAVDGPSHAFRGANPAFIPNRPQ